MLHNFHFVSPTEYFFGRGVERQAASVLKNAGFRRILLHYGQNSVRRSGLLDQIRADLEAEGLSYWELGGVVPNPRAELAEEAGRLCREQELDCILALGGGSALDSAKAAAVFARSEAPSLYAIYSRQFPAEEALPVATVMTFPATGSEASDGTVINFMDQGVKRGYGHDCLRPRFAFLNPELSYSLPSYQTYCGVCDMLAHIMERYFNTQDEAGLTDAWSLALMRDIIQAANQVLVAPRDYAARAQLMWASPMAHCGLLGVGLEAEDWSCHQLEHELSLHYDVAHGAGLAVIYPNWLDFAAQRRPAKIASWARYLFPEQVHGDDAQAAQEGIRAFVRLLHRWGLPLDFKELGIPEERIPQMAQHIRYEEDGRRGAYFRMGAAEAQAIYREAARPWRERWGLQQD